MIHAFAWIGTVPHHIAKTINVGNVLLADVLKHGRKGFEVAVDVTQNGTPHRKQPQGL
jgi:hypothetical protein